MGWDGKGGDIGVVWEAGCAVILESGDESCDIYSNHACLGWRTPESDIRFRNIEMRNRMLFSERGDWNWDCGIGWVVDR